MVGYHEPMTQLGLAITFLTTTILVIEFFRHRQRRLAFYGLAGLVGLLSGEILVFAGFQPVAIYSTPIAWTCYILLADAAVLAMRGHSRLHDAPGQFAGVALLSVPLWLIFEAYNLRLQNWTYAGVPQAWPLALLGYAWSFATITPGIFETADLIECFGWFRPADSITFSRVVQRWMVLFGATCLLLPLILPQTMARRLFVLVWIGFIFLLDPINYQLGLPVCRRSSTISAKAVALVSMHCCFLVSPAAGYGSSGIIGLLQSGTISFPCSRSGKSLRCRYPDIWVSSHLHWSVSQCM